MCGLWVLNNMACNKHPWERYTQQTWPLFLQKAVHSLKNKQQNWETMDTKENHHNPEDHKTSRLSVNVGTSPVLEAKNIYV